jgi:xanthine dehydrogenase iron-sulfur cluster and FAD-binding subunit A
MSKLKPDAIEILDLGMDGSKRCLSLGVQLTLQATYQTPDLPEPVRYALRDRITWQERTEITVERAVRSPIQAPMFNATLLALGAHVVFFEAEIGDSPLAEYMSRVGKKRGKLGAVRIPIEVPGRLWGESHVSRTPTDKPIVAAIAVVDLESDQVVRARLGLTGAWRETAHLAEAADLLIGDPLTEENIEKVIKAVEAEVSPKSDYLGSEIYRRSMAGLLARRAFEVCRKGAIAQ